MSYKYILTLRKDHTAHLYLDEIKELIKNDNTLMPQMRKMLLLMKRYKMSFIVLPLQISVIIDSDNKCNYEAAIQPKQMPYNCTKWTVNDIKKFKLDEQQFIDDLKELYAKMGYTISELLEPTYYEMEKLRKEFSKNETTRIIDQLKD